MKPLIDSATKFAGILSALHIMTFLDNCFSNILIMMPSQTFWSALSHGNISILTVVQTFWSALHWAADRDNEELVYILLEAGINPTIRDMVGGSWLLYFNYIIAFL